MHQCLLPKSSRDKQHIQLWGLVQGSVSNKGQPIEVLQGVLVLPDDVELGVGDSDKNLKRTC